MPNYAYFDHSAHVTRGVGCVSCHGRVDTMEQVTQVERLSMGWCLECHRNPEPHLRPREFVTRMDWTPNEPPEMLGPEASQGKQHQSVHGLLDMSSVNEEYWRAWRILVVRRRAAWTTHAGRLQHKTAFRAVAGCN